MPESRPREPAGWSTIELDEASIGRSTPDVEHERAVAIFDLIEENTFRAGRRRAAGLTSSISHRRQPAGVRHSREDGEPVVTHILSLTPFRRIVKDYFMICDSYYAAIRTSTPSQIEAIDMGRRGAAQRRLADPDGAARRKIEIDFDTARRLFTLVCVLHWKG